MTGILFLVVGDDAAQTAALIDRTREKLADDRRFAVLDACASGSRDRTDGDTEDSDPWAEPPDDLKTKLARKIHVLAGVPREGIQAASAWHSEVKVLAVSPQGIVQAPASFAGLDVLAIEAGGTVEDSAAHLIDTVTHAIPGKLFVRHVAIDTWRDHICFLRRDCTAYPAPDYLGPNKVAIKGGAFEIRARVNVLDDDRVVGRDEIGLSRDAFDALGLPEGAKVTLERASPPDSVGTLRNKVGGGELDTEQMRDVIRDIVAYRYTEREIVAFLVAAAKELSLTEIQALTRARSEYAHRFSWPREMIVDKHSMGGVPGSRISMIVIPIVAAHGFWIPKTSSRAITSPAGTADAMECVANVDLAPETLREIVQDAGGCIAWNGRLSHSPVDDVMNSITRPLGIDSTKLAVTSILSKKVAAGSSHVVIDIPYGTGTKVERAEDARELAALFEAVGRGVDLTVKAIPTDASEPIGRGIGPALEVRDVWSVLRNDRDAPADLREKALTFAGIILGWDDGLEDGLARARALLEDGSALRRMERIVDLQGRRETPAGPGVLTHEVLASRSGEVSDVDCYRIATIARRAGAPMDKGAGLDLHARVGTRLTAGDPVYSIHANVETDFRRAIDAAEQESGFSIV